MNGKKIAFLLIILSAYCSYAQHKFTSVKVTNTAVEVKTNQLEELKDFDWESTVKNISSKVDAEVELKLGFELKNAKKYMDVVPEIDFLSKNDQVNIAQYFTYNFLSKRPKKYGFSVEGKIKDIEEMVSIINSVINKIE
jgi:hypothetical protein